MPALENIAIKGFKSIRDIEVELRDINVLIGANGSGKSNFIEVLSFLQADSFGGCIHSHFVDEAFDAVCCPRWRRRETTSLWLQSY